MKISEIQDLLNDVVGVINEIPDPEKVRGFRYPMVDELRGVALMLSEVIGWQPIETAPKDGTCILVFNGNILSAHWLALNPEVGIWLLTESGSDVGAGDLSAEPSHWMPLPEAPTV